VRMREAVRCLRDTQARDGIARQDLNVRGMARNRCLARSIMAGAFTSFGGDWTPRPASTAQPGLSPMDGFR
jgi:hypothetical protein